MNEIQVRVVYHVTKEELSKTSKEDIQKYAVRQLSDELSYRILNKIGIFKTEERKDGIRFCAECYVLTPNDFSELVEKIQRDLIRFEHIPVIGGIH